MFSSNQFFQKTLPLFAVAAFLAASLAGCGGAARGLGKGLFGGAGRAAGRSAAQQSGKNVLKTAVHIPPRVSLHPTKPPIGGHSPAAKAGHRTAVGVGIGVAEHQPGSAGRSALKAGDESKGGLLKDLGGNAVDLGVNVLIDDDDKRKR